MPFQYKVRNSDSTFGDMKKFGVEETSEEKATRLEQENQLLLNSMMEMSSYMANQEQRIAGQENAIMELSTLIAALPGGESNV
ncbi:MULTISPECIES: hypothetical protein [Lysinibacillus]|uniref:Uncharacterized protein n=1 Tax=Lysinibacillus tabacifolii TaxID=1173107 RepID=A0ABY2T223_9BACI|nr:hypothetical protein [Lysinibacillus tabacifolii]TKI49871.1 hypothetical protein FC748_01210 [Lysinibacillus tabacifolii]